jgi:hypothetical protein
MRSEPRCSDSLSSTRTCHGGHSLDALKALLEMLPDAVVERNNVLPEKIPAGGLIILRDGDPGEPEQALGGFGNAYYQHAVEIEVYVEEGNATGRRCLR